MGQGNDTKTPAAKRATKTTPFEVLNAEVFAGRKALGQLARSISPEFWAELHGEWAIAQTDAARVRRYRVEADLSEGAINRAIDARAQAQPDVVAAALAPQPAAVRAGFVDLTGFASHSLCVGASDKACPLDHAKSTPLPLAAETLSRQLFRNTEAQGSKRGNIANTRLTSGFKKLHTVVAIPSEPNA